MGSQFAMDPIYISNNKKPSYEMKRRETKLDKEWPRMSACFQNFSVLPKLVCSPLSVKFYAFKKKVAAETLVYNLNR